MARRQRIDSATAAVQVMALSARKIAPPKHVKLNKSDRHFWDSLVSEFARSELTDHKLELVALLARTMSDLASEQAAMRAEGSVVTTESGNLAANPRKAIIQMYLGAIPSLRRSLGLNSRAQDGEVRDVAKRREMAKGIEANNAYDGGDLLAKPEGYMQ